MTTSKDQSAMTLSSSKGAPISLLGNRAIHDIRQLPSTWL